MTDEEKSEEYVKTTYGKQETNTVIAKKKQEAGR